MTYESLQQLGATLCLALLSACGTSGSDETPTPEGGSTGGTLWVVAGSIPTLEGLDTSNGEVGVHVQIGDSSTDVDSLVAADGLVWVGRTDGAVVAVDPSSGKIAKTLDVDAAGSTIEMMAAGGGAAYAASGSADGLPMLAAIDPQGWTVKAEPVLSTIAWFAGVAYESGTLWVLAGNDFALSKVDAATLAVKGRVPLGRNSKDPQGARGEFYGNGSMAVTSTKIWVIDTTTNQLLSVDKASLQASYVSDLGDLLDAGGSQIFVSNGDSAFLALPDQGKVIRFDGETGARAQTYAFGVGVASDLAVTKNKLYLTDNHVARDVFEVDVQSGATTNTYKDVRPLALASE